MRVLLADGDGSRSKGLAEALAEAGHVVDRALHGPAALELALERVPDVVVVPTDLGIIDGARLAEILRGNPRTRAASFVFLVEDELDAPIALHLRDRIAVSPWRPEEVVALIDGTEVPTDRSDQTEPVAEIEGKLSQLSLTDLLQMFHLGRKSGALRIAVHQMVEPGEIHLADGQIVDASLQLADGGRMEGEKALFRLMNARQGGRFSFAPGVSRVSPSVSRPTRELLLEGAREMDEWARLVDQLPDRDTILECRIDRDQLEANAHPAVREVVAVVESHGRLGDVLDRCSIADTQVARVLVRLLQHGALAVASEEPPTGPLEPDGEGIFTANQRRRLRDWIATQVPRPGTLLKVPLIPADERALDDFVTIMRECTDFVVAQGAEDAGTCLARVGSFPLGDGLEVRLVAVPPGRQFAPTWELAAHGMLGALMLLRTPLAPALQEVADVVTIFRQTSERPVVQVVETASGAPTLGEAERAELERMGGGSLLVLPTDLDPERLAILRNIFSRLIA